MFAIFLLQNFSTIDSAIRRAEANGVNTINAVLMTIIFIAFIWVACFILRDKAKKDEGTFNDTAKPSQ